jgi:hypothetical protein
MSRARKISKVHALALAQSFERGDISEAEYLAAALDEPPIVEGERYAGRRILSLDHIPLMAIPSPLPSQIALERLMDAAMLTPDERRYLEATLRGVPRRKLAVHFGWPPRTIDAVRMRLRRRLMALGSRFEASDFVVRGNSSTLSYIERLPSGRGAWTLAELGENFPELMATERERPVVPKTLFAVA